MLHSVLLSPAEPGVLHGRSGLPAIQSLPGAYILPVGHFNRLGCVQGLPLLCDTLTACAAVLHVKPLFTVYVVTLYMTQVPWASSMSVDAATGEITHLGGTPSSSSCTPPGSSSPAAAGAGAAAGSCSAAAADSTAAGAAAALPDGSTVVDLQGAFVMPVSATAILNAVDSAVVPVKCYSNRQARL
jgi:hypothetical protein